MGGVLIHLKMVSIYYIRSHSLFQLKVSKTEILKCSVLVADDSMQSHFNSFFLMVMLNQKEACIIAAHGGHHPDIIAVSKWKCIMPAKKIILN